MMLHGGLKVLVSFLMFNILAELPLAVTATAVHQSESANPASPASVSKEKSGYGIQEGFRQTRTHGETLKSRSTILLMSQALAGHIIPLVTLGKELIVRGHNVYLAAPWVSPKMPGRLLNGTGIRYVRMGTESMSEEERGKHAIAIASNKGPFALLLDLWVFRIEQNLWMTRALLESASLAPPHEGIEMPVSGGGAEKDQQVRPDLIVADISAGQTGEAIARRYNIPLVYNSGTFNDHTVPPFSFPLFGTAVSWAEMTLWDRLLSDAWRLFAIRWWIGRLAELQVAVRQRDWLLKSRLYPEPGHTRPLLVNNAVDYLLPATPLVTTTGPLLYPSHAQVQVAATEGPEAHPELQAWLAKWPTRSVVVVSMGSLVDLPENQGQALLAGLLSLERPVLWGAPLGKQHEFLVAAGAARKAFRVEGWLPQRAVLAHNATAVMVGHCGAGGTQEALYWGIPVLCLPLFLDQPGVAARLRDSGAGLSLDPKTLTTEKVQQALAAITAAPQDGQLCTGHISLIAQLSEVEENGDSSQVPEPLQAGVHNCYVAAAQRLSRHLRTLGGTMRAADVVEHYLYDVPASQVAPALLSSMWKTRGFIVLCSAALALALLLRLASGRRFMVIFGRTSRVKVE